MIISSGWRTCGRLVVVLWVLVNYYSVPVPEV